MTSCGIQLNLTTPRLFDTDLFGINYETKQTLNRSSSVQTMEERLIVDQIDESEKSAEGNLRLHLKSNRGIAAGFELDGVITTNTLGYLHHKMQNIQLRLITSNMDFTSGTRGREHPDHTVFFDIDLRNIVSYLTLYMNSLFYLADDLDNHTFSHAVTEYLDFFVTAYMQTALELDMYDFAKILSLLPQNANLPSIISTSIKTSLRNKDVVSSASIYYDRTMDLMSVVHDIQNSRLESHTERKSQKKNSERYSSL